MYVPYGSAAESHWTDPFTGLKSIIRGNGTWRIRKREKSSVVEVFKIEESGYGDIISPAFSAWRSKTGMLK